MSYRMTRFWILDFGLWIFFQSEICDPKSKMRMVCLAKKNQNTKTTSTSPMDMGLLEQMTRLMKENDLNTVDVRDGDKRVILKRGAPIAPSGSSGFIPQYAPAAQ